MTHLAGPDLSPEQTERLNRLVAALANVSPPCRLRLNRNRRTIISLRRSRRGGCRLSLHVGLLDHPEALAELPQWTAAGGRARCPALKSAIAAVWADQARIPPATPPPALEPLGGPLDLHAVFDRVHAIWFSHLPKPRVAWARSGPRRRLRAIRFGAYRRHGTPTIFVNPRLDRPWVARAFVEHVLHHELCHHAQHCQPVRGERPHSPRFHAWESTYPLHREAIAWQRHYLSHLLE